MELSPGTTILVRTPAPSFTPVYHPKGDKGDTGAAGGSDAATADHVTNGALTKAALSATIAAENGSKFVTTHVVTDGDRTGATNAYPTLQAHLNSGAAHVHIAGPATYRIDSALLLPATLRRFTMDSTVTIAQNSNTTVLRRQGSSDGVARPLVTPVKRVRTITFSSAGSTSDLAVGDWLFITSTDGIRGTTDRCGMLRQVTSVDGSATVGIDAAIYRTLSSSPVAYKVTLAPSIHVDGGVLTFNTRSAKTASMVEFSLVEEPSFGPGLTLSGGGGPGIIVSGTVDGGMYGTTITDLLDDAATSHFGYAVQLAGPTRGFQALSGSVSRVRHAVTTTAGVSPNLAALQDAGEPEHCHWGPVSVRATTSTGVDTHVPGYALTFQPNVEGCIGGVSMRCEAATILPGLISGCQGFGLAIQASAYASVVKGPRVRDTVGASSTAVTISSATRISDLEVEGTSSTGTGLVLGAACEVDNVSVDNDNATGTTFGIALNSSGNRVRNTVVRNAVTGTTEAAGQADNELDVVYVGCTTNESLQTPRARVDRYATAGRLAVGEESVHRASVGGNIAGLVSGTVYLTYFTARKSETVANVRMLSAGQAAAATPTLAKMGFYEVGVGGALTLRAATASDPTLFAAQYTPYTRALSSSFSKVAGRRYALAFIVITAVAMPNITGQGVLLGSEAFMDPPLSARVIGQADLPANVAVGSLANFNNLFYGVALP